MQASRRGDRRGGVEEGGGGRVHWGQARGRSQGTGVEGRGQRP